MRFVKYSINTKSVTKTLILFGLRSRRETVLSYKKLHEKPPKYHEFIHCPKDLSLRHIVLCFGCSQFYVCMLQRPVGMVQSSCSSQFVSFPYHTFTSIYVKPLRIYLCQVWDPAAQPRRGIRTSSDSSSHFQLSLLALTLLYFPLVPVNHTHPCGPRICIPLCWYMLIICQRFIAKLKENYDF